MVEVEKLGVVLDKRQLDFEIEGVLNPAVYQENGIIKMIYRAVGKGNTSTLGYCEFEVSNPSKCISRLDRPLLCPENQYESQGVEDPRIVKIDRTFFLTYTGYDGNNALACLATSTDLMRFEKHGIVVPQMSGNEIRQDLSEQNVNNIKYYQPSNGQQIVWDKNVVFFPRKINGKFAFLHRIRPGIQYVEFKEISDLTGAFWKNYMKGFVDQIVLDPKYPHELSYIGNGAPPIETEFGWLLIYHGVHDTATGYQYVACAALLDLANPRQEISRLSKPLFVPDQPFELEGYVNYVCFPTGTAIVGKELLIYYGAADERIALASVNIESLLQDLLSKSKS